jgi:histidyl-tRNA synthetase
LSSLRDKGIVAAPFLDADKKLKNQMEFADKIGAKFSVIIGKDEADNQQVSLKSMASGEQETVSAKDVAERIKSHLSGEHGL